MGSGASWEDLLSLQPSPEPEQTEARGEVGTGREDQDRGAARSHGRVHPRRGGQGLRALPGGHSASQGSGQWPVSPGADRDPGLPFLQPRRGSALQVGAGPSPGLRVTLRPVWPLPSRKGGQGLSVALLWGRLCQAVLLARRLYSGVKTGGLPSGRGACGGPEGAASQELLVPGGRALRVTPPPRGRGVRGLQWGCGGRGRGGPSPEPRGAQGPVIRVPPTSIRGPVTPLDRCGERSRGLGSWRSVQ